MPHTSNLCQNSGLVASTGHSDLQLFEASKMVSVPWSVDKARVLTRLVLLGEKHLTVIHHH